MSSPRTSLALHFVRGSRTILPLPLGEGRGEGRPGLGCYTAASTVVIAFSLLAGCTERAAVTTSSQNAKKQTETVDNLKLAMESMRKLAERTDAAPAHRTIFYLNEWLARDEAANSPWQPDRQLESLPRALRDTPGLDRVRQMQFSLDAPTQWLDDISYLQQNLWLHDIADRVRREEPAKHWQPWLKEIESSVGIPEAEQLATAERLLDWVARNIQLDKLPSMPVEPRATTGAEKTVLPADRGEVGPGYSNLPLETLLYGHGDAHERARVFILLCRQAGIDAVMLGFPQEQTAGYRAWCPAVLVGDKLYLFDTQLGLPIPGPEGKGIATLEQVVKDPQLLRRLDFGRLPTDELERQKEAPEFVYPVSEKDLKRGVQALIDAEPAALSRRMLLLEGALPRATKLALAVEPSRLEPLVRRSKGVSGVTLWSVPFYAVRYKIGRVRLAASGNQQVAKELHRLNVTFAPARPLVRARNLHLQARYENEGQKQLGARSLYLQCRPPNREIDSLLTNEGYRKSVIPEQALPQDPAQRQQVLDFYVEIAREGKQDATYWLGLSYYDAGKEEPAIEWLTRTAEDSPASPWLPGAKYNLARCYEQLGQTALARQWLTSDTDSPQRHGNLVRAKLLLAEPASE